MAKKKNFYYVMVFTNSGPVFVTAIHYSNKTAEWNKLDKPLEMSKSEAEDLTFGLMVNFNTAFTIVSPIKYNTQPYRYDAGHFEWKFDDKEDKPDEKVE